MPHVQSNGSWSVVTSKVVIMLLLVQCFATLEFCVQCMDGIYVPICFVCLFLVVDFWLVTIVLIKSWLA